MIYFDNSASTYFKPPEVVRAFSGAITEYAANPGRSGHPLSRRCADAVYESREIIAERFGCQPEHVVFTSGATAAINTALKGYLHSGDEVIISDLEHNAVLRPLYALKKRGVTVRVAKTDMKSDSGTVRAFRELITHRTRLIAVTGASNVFGRVLPVPALGRLCRSGGIRLLVDGAQSAGHIIYDMKRDGIDFLCLAGHKGLYGPQGIGALLLGGEILLTPLTEGGTGTESKSLNQPLLLPERLESGTLNMPGIVAFGVAVKTSHSEEFQKRLRGGEVLLTYAYERLKAIGAALYTPFPAGSGYIPVLSFNMPGRTANEVAEALNNRQIYTRPGFHCSPSAHRKAGTLAEGTVRVSFSVYNNIGEIDSMIACLSS